MEYLIKDAAVHNSTLIDGISNRIGPYSNNKRMDHDVPSYIVYRSSKYHIVFGCFGRLCGRLAKQMIRWFSFGLKKNKKQSF